METTVTVMSSTWGTWEELLLSAAIIRHGTQDWNLIALQLRERITSPYTFTPEVCKGKYEDLQKRYSKTESTALYEELKNTRMIELKKALEESQNSIGWDTWEELLLGGAVLRHDCKAKYENLQQRYSESDSTALFEKLKKTRIVELKKSLEQSEDSIGSLKSKIEFLKAEKDKKKDDDYENGSRRKSCIFSGTCKKQRGKRKRKDYMNEEAISVEDDVDSWWKKSSTNSNTKRCEVPKSYVAAATAGVYDPNRSLKKQSFGYEDMSDVLGYFWIGGMEWNRVDLNGAKSVNKETHLLTMKKKKKVVGRTKKFGDGNSGLIRPYTPMLGRKRVRTE